jgi:hypothetical protein
VSARLVGQDPPKDPFHASVDKALEGILLIGLVIGLLLGLILGFIAGKIL